MIELLIDHKTHYIRLLQIAVRLLRQVKTLGLLNAIYSAEDILHQGHYEPGLVLRQWINESLRLKDAPRVVAFVAAGEELLLLHFFEKHGLKDIDINEYRQAWALHLIERMRAWK